MGNEDKIKDLVERSKSRFLPEVLDDSETGRVTYSLPDEFAKTKKNKPIALYFFVLGFTAAVVACTLFFTLFIEDKNRKIDVHFADFEDLRLREVLDSARGTDTELELAKGALQALEVGKLEAILDVHKKYLKREMDIISAKEGNAEAESRVKELRHDEAREVADVGRSYDDTIAGKKREIAAIINKKEAENRKLRKEEKKAGALNNYDRLYNLRMEKMKKANEAGVIGLRRYSDRGRAYLIERYNPFFKSPSVQALLGGSRDFAGDRSRFFRTYNDIITAEGVFTKDRFSNMRNRVMDQRTLIAMLQCLPYENSIPGMLSQIDNLSGSICNDYESLWSGLATVIRKKNEKINSYEAALNHVLKEKPESGYVIDTRNEKAVVVYMNRILQIREGESAYVFRNDDEYIGKIEFYHTADGLRARIVENARGASVRPFDKILMQKKIQEKP